MKAIVLAGGGGTRLWPLSREDLPKQFLHLGFGESLLQKTIQRLLHAPFIDEILVATNERHRSLVERQIPLHDKLHLVIEPSRKNTAPAIGLTIKYLEKFCGLNHSDPILVIPSDHLIEPEAIFLSALEEVIALRISDQILTFGIRPTKAETGYGYIEVGHKFNRLAFHVARFVEKPDRLTAEVYLKNPQIYWNSGMFVFSSKTFWFQLKTYSPDLYKLMNGCFEEVVERFDQMPNISIDYAIMEKSPDILVCPLALSWSDIGCWDSVYELMEKDLAQNVKIGHIVDVDTKNCLIIGGKKLISTIGLEDMLIVETEEALFVSKRGESQKVKELVHELVQRGKVNLNPKMQIEEWGTTYLLDATDRGVVKKIQILPQKTCTLKGSWIPLSLEPIQSVEGLFNPFEEAIELIFVENIPVMTGPKKQPTS